jgi:predicted RecA/RadA family phage recombinase
MKGQWICGNKVADPGEDCSSCPGDIAECACLKPSPGIFEEELGRSFFLCRDQKAKIEGVDIELLSVLSHKLGVSTPDGNIKAILLGEGEKADVWYWAEHFLHSYTLTLEKKINNGVRIRLDYPEMPLGEEFTINNGQMVKLSDTGILLLAKINSTDQTVNLEIFQDGSSTTETLTPGENISVGNHTIELVSVIDGGVSLIVNGGGGS